MYKVLILLFLLAPICTLGKDKSFTCLKSEGNVQQELNNKVKRLNSGDKLSEGSTINTSAKSFAIISTINKNRITIGPNSSLQLISHKKDQPPIIKLIQGKIRVLAQKSLTDEKKILIRTRTVSAGVRGTDFLMVFNPKNNITSTLTFSGTVSQINTGTNRDNSFEAINNDLDTSVASHIKGGEFSGGYLGYSYPTEATKIDPLQFEILQKNQQLVSQKEGKVISSGISTIDLEDEDKTLSENSKEIRDKALVPAPSGLKSNEYIDQDHEIIRPRPGGYLDLKTGIYISPPPSAKFDSQKQVYIQEDKFGGVNAQSGEYVPPPGTVLTDDQGFIAIGTKAVKKVSVLLAKLNRKIKDNFIDRIKEKYKENEILQRAQVSAETSFSFDSNVTHELHDELLEVANSSSGIFDGSIGIGHRIVESRRWRIIPKGQAEIKLHTNQANLEVDKHDMGNLMGGLEIHHKYRARHEEAKHFLNLEINSSYKDYRDRDRFTFYNRDLSVEFGEDLVLVGRHRTQLSYRYLTYETYSSSKRGEMHSVFFKHFVPMGRRFKISFNGTYHKKINELSASQGKIQKYGVEMYRMNIMKNTDLLIDGYFKQSQRTNRPNFYEYSGGFSLIKDMKNALWGEIGYQYVRNQTELGNFDIAKHVFDISLFFKI